MDYELRMTLGQIYRFLREQREANFEIQKASTAMLETLKTVPGFAYPRYKAAWDEASRQLDGPHAEAMQMLNTIVRGLERVD